MHESQETANEAKSVGLTDVVVWYLIGPLRQAANAEHDIIGPVADRAAADAPWHDIFRCRNIVQHYGGCGYPDYGIPTAVSGDRQGPFAPRGFQPNFNDSSPITSDLQPARLAADAGSAVSPEAVADTEIAIGTGVVIYQAGITGMPTRNLSRVNRAANRDRWSLQTGYDSAYDAAMGHGRDPFAGVQEESALFWQMCQSEVARRVSRSRLYETAKEWRFVTVLQRALQAAEQVELVASGPTQVSTSTVPTGGYQAASLATTPSQQRVLLRTADALQDASSALAGLAEHLRAWAVPERTAFVAEVER